MISGVLRLLKWHINRNSDVFMIFQTCAYATQENVEKKKKTVIKYPDHVSVALVI